MTSSLSPPLIAEYEAFAVRLSQLAAEVILPLFRSGISVEDKGGEGRGFDPVTLADKAAESAIRAEIARVYPDHGVIGEEHGEDRPDAAFVWVLDPIDGTRAFIAGLPLWTTLIALRCQGRPAVGLIGQPYLGEVYVGSASGSRSIDRHGERPLSVRACPKLTDAVIATTDPDLFNGPEAGAWRQVRQAARLARYGCDGYAFAQVAAGHLDLVLEAGLRAWDIESAMPLIEGAGGVCTDWRGAPIGSQGGQVAAAGDPACLQEALVALRRAAT